MFGDGAERVRAFADWYYAWGRPFDLLWRGAGSVASRVGRPGMETLGEAVGRDTSDYLMAQFTAQVLRPELRDPPLREGIRRALVGAHDRYLAAVRQQDFRFQLFLARRTTHLEAPADGGLKVAFDWDAQRWKAPTYLMEDRAFDGVRTLVTLGAGGTLGAAALGPAVDGLLAASLGRVAVRAAAGVATEVEAGTAGGAAGSWLPGAGTALGAAGGAAVALGVDYAWGRLRERSGRGELEARGDEALAAVRDALAGEGRHGAAPRGRGLVRRRPGRRSGPASERRCWLSEMSPAPVLATADGAPELIFSTPSGTVCLGWYPLRMETKLMVRTLLRPVGPGPDARGLRREHPRPRPQRCRHRRRRRRRVQRGYRRQHDDRGRPRRAAGAAAGVLTNSDQIDLGKPIWKR